MQVQIIFDLIKVNLCKYLFKIKKGRQIADLQYSALFEYFTIRKLL